MFIIFKIRVRSRYPIHNIPYFGIKFRYTYLLKISIEYQEKCVHLDSGYCAFPFPSGGG
jgi:hypothetical protein